MITFNRFAPLLLGAALLSNVANAQSAAVDSVYTNEGTLAVNVKEITETGIRYTYPNEDVINTVFKNSVYRVRYKSGRVQSFAEALTLNPVNGGDDWEKVMISKLESEVKGLYKLEDVNAKAKGTTEFSNVNKVKNRAFDKLRMETAMLGGNVVFLTDQATNGNLYGSRFQSARSTETFLSGIAYSNRRPAYAGFMSQIGSGRDFYLKEIQRLGNNSTEISKTPGSTVAHIDSIADENGQVFVTMSGSELVPGRYRLTYFDSQRIVLMTRDRKQIINLVLGMP
ncbi:hypothetical protein J2I47_24910 [Fibrella sp. HMF5335]|uniref:DUF4831 domain-containing protein n=1 Tax=Fibrella rubiginis TaxID=2817060 RepID=A0A939GN11_9BACT|nr:hypothetical protein [Fibrella rubiginis]MBO0939810.1 hypothetical protein [Fibrella rubiginis]